MKSVFRLGMHCFMFCNYLYEEKRAGCFVLFSFGYLVAVKVLYLFLTVPWVCLQLVIMVFPDHTHLHFGNKNPYKN